MRRRPTETAFSTSCPSRSAQAYEAGDAYYAPPGHTPKLYAGSQVVEFSPSRELQQTREVVEKNMAAAGA